MHQNSTDDLSSECGIDYRRLRDLLAAREWEEADEETADKMLAPIGKEGWWNVETEDIEKIPCTDLRTIDRLWVQYSNEHFGFSVQKQIWQGVGGQPGMYDYYIYKKFYDKFYNIVGWQAVIDRSSEYVFNLNAPRGHLPLVGVMLLGQFNKFIL